ncbi:MAG TPA: bifunctional glutamate--cysteine ligase GshA/glutathione synthetase GshB [Clostridiaceae bacterium]|nr:bifunctional glutamate--cysteine ligase GshA/glutathione synthetase GshB [Clostridiaceae bacterium]
MEILDNKLMDIVNRKGLEKCLLNCNFGLEKENIRVDETGRLVQTPHPAIFGNRLKNPYIKTDFSESQVEMATPVCHTIEDTYNSLEMIHDTVCLNIGGEYLWPQSNPPALPEEDEIPIANMGDEYEDRFRAVLAMKYGRKRQVISGIHYNFSFDEAFIDSICGEFPDEGSFMDFRNKLYLKICRNFMRYRWMLIYMTGASPVFHDTFIKKYVDESCRMADGTCYYQNMVSLRNSDYGYKNRNNFYIPFDSVDGYVGEIKKYVDSGELQDICEFYGPIRLKTGNDDNLSHELIEKGIQYIEIRILDLNPLYKIGISRDILYFIHMFLLYMLFKDDETYDMQNHLTAEKNAQIISFQGRQEGLFLYDDSSCSVPFKDKALDILNAMLEMLKCLNLDSEYLSGLIEEAKDMVKNPSKTFSGIIFDEAREKSYMGFHMGKAVKYLNESRKKIIV